MATSPLRVTHVIPQIGIGGAELQLARLIALTPADRARHDVLYYSDSLDEEGYRVYREAGIDIARVRRGRVATPAFIGRLAMEIRRRRPDILHCWLETAAIWGRWGGFFARVPRVVLSMRTTGLELPRALRLSHRIGGHGVHYLANSRAVARVVASCVGLPPSEIRVIPNGIDLGAPASTLTRAALLGEHRCPPDTRIVLSVGRLTEAKNYPMLLRVAVRCRERLPVHFFIAGHGEDETALRALASRLGVEGIVHFLGLRHDVPALLAAADLFCYTSIFEGFPNALLEALAAARPIVTTRFAGTDEIVEDGRTALVVGQDDDAAAFEAVARLMADPDLAARLGGAARRDAETRFEMRRMVDATLAYYATLMPGAP
jgi:glycosyltransferase involved in cell wall biosynthesis